MAEGFVPEFDAENIPPSISNSAPHNNRERLRFLMIGPVEYIRDMQIYLAYRGIAEVGAWSRLLPAPDTAEMMSILVQYRKRNGSA